MIETTCAGCGRKMRVPPALAKRPARCRACRQGGAAAPPAGRPTTRRRAVVPTKKRSTLKTVLIVVGVVAGVIVVAIVGLSVLAVGAVKAAQEASEKEAASALRRIVAAEEHFRSNDLDRNSVPDYWTSNVAGLYCLQRRETMSAVAALNDIGVASADLDPRNASCLEYATEYTVYNPELLLPPGDHHGYSFQALLSDSVGTAYAQSTDGGPAVHNSGNFGFAAFPLIPGARTMIVSEGASVFGRVFDGGPRNLTAGKPLETFDGKTPLNYPTASELSSRWRNVE